MVVKHMQKFNYTMNCSGQIMKWKFFFLAVLTPPKSRASKTQIYYYTIEVCILGGERFDF
jgi:hypothetical protein